MKVRARLWLFGAVLPTGGTLVAILLAGQLFRLSLVRALDDVLRSQAAVESLSLFDGPSGEPHLVLTASQIKAARPFAEGGVVAVYDRDGAPVIRFPEGAHIPERLRPGAAADGPQLQTRYEAAMPVRELRVTVAARDGRSYLLRLASPLTSVAATTRVFYQVTLSVCAAMALLLFAIQGYEARRLAGRIRVMTEHLPRLREGDFHARLPADDAGDEIAELRTALAEVSDRLKEARDAQDRLIASAAHELRTPLTVMHTEMDLALRRERSAAELRDALVGARQEVDRLADLASKLLDLAVKGRARLDLRPGDLAGVAREAVEGYRAEAQTRGVAIALDAPSEAAAWFDPAGVRQAIDNYLSNALKFAPRDSRVQVSLRLAGGCFRIEVADDGAGVRAGEEEIVFEPFRRGSKAVPGTGLGLAIVREIARKHGGAAYVRPRDDGSRGACFVLEIPPAMPGGAAPAGHGAERG